MANEQDEMLAMLRAPLVYQVSHREPITPRGASPWRWCWR
jgi:hypothetical protein